MRDTPQIRLTTEKKIYSKTCNFAEFGPGSQEGMRAWSRGVGVRPGGELTCSESRLDAWTVSGLRMDLGQAGMGVSLPLEQLFMPSSHEHQPLQRGIHLVFLGQAHQC